MRIGLSLYSFGLVLPRLTARLSKKERATMLIHHGPTTMEVAEYLGFLVKCELNDGMVAIGRVDAVDDHYVYLGRTERWPKILLHNIKQVDRA